jgi:predicted ester cyclase
MTLDPRSFAPYETPEEYILDWTDRIWADAGIGAIGGMYVDGVIVRGAYGTSVGVEPVVRGSLAKKAAFPDRIGVGEDVVWEERGDRRFVSYHRVLHTGVQGEQWSYGAPTGASAVSRNLPVCLIEDGLVVEEWVARDEWAVVAGLGHDPAEAAARSRVQAGPDGLFGRTAPVDPVVEGESGVRPDTHRAEAEFVREAVETVFGARRFDLVDRYYGRDSVLHTSRNRTVTRQRGIQNDALRFLAPFPDAEVQVRDIAVHHTPDRGTRASVLWRVAGTYTGLPLYGPAGGEPVEIMGISQYELRGGRIAREYRVFDEVAVLAQVLEGRRGSTACESLRVTGESSERSRRSSAISS